MRLSKSLKNQVKAQMKSFYRLNAPGLNAYRFSISNGCIYRGEYVGTREEFGPYEYKYSELTGEFSRNKNYKPSLFA